MLSSDVFLVVLVVVIAFARLLHLANALFYCLNANVFRFDINKISGLIFDFVS
jgi:hypothetical protein